MAPAAAQPVERQRRAQLAASQARAQRQAPRATTQPEDRGRDDDEATPQRSQRPTTNQGRQAQLQQRQFQAAQEARTMENEADERHPAAQLASFIQRNPVHEAQYTLLNKSLSLVPETLGISLILTLPLYNIQMIWGSWIRKGDSLLVAPLTWDSFNFFREGFPPAVKSRLNKGAFTKLGPTILVLMLNILTAVLVVAIIGPPLILLIVGAAIVQDPTGFLSGLVSGQYGDLGELAKQFMGI